MERIFSGAWKDKRGQTQTNNEDSEETQNDDKEKSEEVFYMRTYICSCISEIQIKVKNLLLKKLCFFSCSAFRTQ